MITIGKLAAIAEVSTDTLRYYERERLIEPAGKSVVATGSMIKTLRSASVLSNTRKIADLASRKYEICLS